MKKYDFQKAKKYIEENKDNILSVAMGMHEDWFWTADIVFAEGEYKASLAGGDLIAGIDGSCWATPVMEVIFKDGAEKIINCYTGESTEEGPPGLFGSLSGPVQDARGLIDTEEDEEE